MTKFDELMDIITHNKNKDKGKNENAIKNIGKIDDDRLPAGVSDKIRIFPYSHLND